MVKRFLALFLFVLISVDSFAAIVGDNDGGAFVTKAEFETLKIDFNKQINRYNSSIDNKIDGAISSYLQGIELAKKIELDSKLNKFSAYHFSKNFNYFGRSSQYGTRVGDQYKWWSCYNGVWGIDHASLQDDDTHKMVSIRGGTGITDITEKSAGTIQDRFCVVTKSGYDSALPQPSYMMSTYNYYTMMWMCSNYGTKVTSPWTTTHQFTLTGDLSGSSYFGTRFWQYNPILPSVNQFTASVMYSAMPVDTIWSNYDLNCLCGDQINETDKCMIIYSENLMKLGDADGTFESVTEVEHMYWNIGQGRTHDDSGANSLKITKYKRKYDNFYWKDFIIDSVSNTAKKKSYYYSGLPIFTSNYNGEVTLKLKAVNDGGYSTTIAISEDQFDNTAIGSGGIDKVSDNECTRTDWEFSSGTTYEIKFRVKKDTTYWIKAAPTENWTKSTLTTSKIELLTD